jgi:hypothetical protein
LQYGYGTREGEGGCGMSRLEILEAEYKRALENPLFDNPAEYCVLLDLIKDEIDRWYKV